VQIATWREEVYIHCANGHGRSASLAALVLVYRGMFRTWREAFAHIQLSRKLAKIHVNQEHIMDEAQALLDETDDASPSVQLQWPQQEQEVPSVRRQCSAVQGRVFKYVRAASDGGIMEMKPSAPWDAAIVEYYKRTGRAIASRSELLASDAGAPKVQGALPPTAAPQGGGVPPASIESPLVEHLGHSVAAPSVCSAVGSATFVAAASTSPSGGRTPLAGDSGHCEEAGSNVLDAAHEQLSEG
jgi:hypothetical protein